jgi:hypothetical protein
LPDADAQGSVVIWKIVAYASILGGFCALATSGFRLHRICLRLSAEHFETYERLGRPSIRRPARWPSNPLREFLGSREYEGLGDPVLAVLCRQFRFGLRVAASFAALAFVGVFASAFGRGA